MTRNGKPFSVSCMARRNLRLFLDSNVIISGLLSSKGAPRVILDLLSLQVQGITGITGAYNLMEVERNLSRKLPRALPLYNEYLPKLQLEVVPLPERAEVDAYLGVIADKDVPVLVSAVNGKADLLVTGDNKDFAKIGQDKGYCFEIVSPAKALERIGEWLRVGT